MTDVSAAGPRPQPGQRDVPPAPLFPLVTDDLARRLQAWLAEQFGVEAEGHAAARSLRERGLCPVDPERHRFLIDEVVYHGAQFRSATYLARAERSERALRRAVHVLPPPAVWAAVSAACGRDVMSRAGRAEMAAGVLALVALLLLGGSEPGPERRTATPIYQEAGIGR